ncbi:MAG: type IV secretory system conjugative DNA transfer family protein [Caulobacterales bacterium]|nr:type IV secretory system conjugative DNA transfer family protein [Caulobacterales bacterium]
MTRLPDTGFLLGRSPREGGRSPIGFRAGRQAEPASDEQAYVVDDSDGHCAVFAPTGAGKKRNVLLPTLLTARNPVIVLDVKGELARETADFRRREMGHAVCILDPWKLVSDGADRFNPLDVINASSPGMPDDAYSMARLLIDQAGPIKEAYWDESAQAVVAGLIAHVIGCPKEDDRSFRRIWQIANSDDPIYGMAVLMDTMPMEPFAKAQIAGLLSLSADNTRSCIVSVLHQHLRVFASESVQTAMSSTTFDLNAVRRGKPLSIYIVAPPSKLRSHAPLLRLWISALMSLILGRQRPPEQPTLLLLDEVAQLGRMDQIPEAITLARGYGMRCMLLLQSYAQLKQAYPNDHEVMIENCASLATFGHSAFSMSKQMAEVLGDVSAEDLFAMGKGSVAVRKAGERTRIVDRVDYLDDGRLVGRAAVNPMFRAV